MDVEEYDDSEVFETTPQGIANALARVDGLYDDGRGGWWSAHTEGDVLVGTFTPKDGDGNADQGAAVQWHAVIQLGPPPIAE